MVAIHDAQIRAHFADRRHWIPCNDLSSCSLSEIPTRISRSLAVANGGLSAYFRNTPTPIEQLESIFCALPSSRASMVVLDDFDALWHHPDPSVRDLASHVLRAACANSQVTVVVTIQGWMQSRPLVADLGSSFQIKTLTPSDAELLFFNVSPRYDHDCKQLLEKIGHFPPSIIRLANICKKQDVNAHALLTPLNEDPSELLMPKAIEGRNTIHSITHLSRDFPSAPKFLFCLSILPVGILRAELDELGRVLGVIQLTELVDALCSLSLADWVPSTANDDRSTRLQIPAHVRVYLLNGNHTIDFGDARARLFAHYFKPAMLEAYASPRRPGTDNSGEAMERRRSEQENVESLLRDRFVNDSGHAVDAIKATIYFFKPLWALRPCFDVMRKVLAIAKEQDDPLLVAHALQSLGEMQQARGYYIPAQRHMNEALQMFKDCKDVQGQAACLHALGVMRHTCWPQTPLQYFEEAYEKYSMMDDRHGQAGFLLDWSHRLRAVKQLADSQRRLEEASAIINVLGNPDLCARRDLRSVRYRHELVDICSVFRDTGNLPDLATCLSYLGDQKGALEIYELLGRDLLAACSMRSMADACASDQEAVRLYDKAIPIFAIADYTYHFAESRLRLGHSLIRLGKIHDAVGILRSTFPLLEYRNDLTLECGIQLVRCLIKTGQSNATIGAMQDILRYDDQKQGECLPTTLRKQFKELENRVRNGEAEIAEECIRAELLALTLPKRESDGSDLDVGGSFVEETSDPDSQDGES
jgi:tetratricopeptide (TPR) repeat protein